MSTELIKTHAHTTKDGVLNLSVDVGLVLPMSLFNRRKTRQKRGSMLEDNREGPQGHYDGLGRR